ncbi:hypothetical protein Acr_13g0012660 [Actinidia rufa]|uniref:Uncharacterized protein n=1 Tax=Actinidia rufa TaxID=165716 RepID=A0A7J0FNA5_9ERIC|nr:hypothetical protein Acr_13g0012660 [Actinidia rufa]
MGVMDSNGICERNLRGKRRGVGVARCPQWWGEALPVKGKGGGGASGGGKGWEGARVGLTGGWNRDWVVVMGGSGR